MSNHIDLQILKQHRADLLLAEVAAWLHDVGKCTSEFAYYPQARSVKTNKHGLDPYKAIFSASEIGQYHFSQQRVQERLNEANQQYALHKLLDDRVRTTLDSIFTVETTPYSFREAIYFSRPRFATRISDSLGRNGEPLDLLANCHGEGHVEKEEPLPSITANTIARYSAFGYLLGNLPKPNQPENLTERLNNLDWQAILQRDLQGLRTLFLDALGDTRFPINEVTLWDWSYSVASLYKPELARHYLTGEWRTRKQLRWHLLRINFDVLGLYAKAVKIGDLLGYQEMVDQACAAVKTLVEEEYPLGNEIYRDSTGIYFTFPDIDLPADLAQEIRRRVEEVEMELAPHIAVTSGDGATAQEQLKGILGKARGQALDDLAQPFDTQNLSDSWHETWLETIRNADEKDKGKWETCPLCGLRPKREGDEVCTHCQKRRDSRLETWLQKSAQTIWLGEIADHNDHVALLVGKFGLDDWLTGDLVQTMLVKAAENAPDQCVPKNPSPARLRRVWDICQQFWDETVLQQIMPNMLNLRQRKYIIPDITNWKPGLYNGKVNGKPLDLYWLPEQNTFLTVSNLDAAGDFKINDSVSLKDSDSNAAAGIFVIQTIEDADDSFAQYQSWLSLLATPDQFLVILSASSVLAIVHEIQKQYVEQFGKVRNRLPLSLGVVYFERKMPLIAVWDAAWQMLNAPLNEEAWQLAQDVADGCVQFKNGVTWNVKTKMGDGSTPDEWYPYYFVEQMDPNKHLRRLQLQKKGDNDPQKVGAVSERYADRWLVHVNDLKQDDGVCVRPSTFDFEYLDSTARRFDIYYDDEGRRPRPTRPYYLEDLGRLDELWDIFSKLSRTQLKQIIQTIETARERWHIPADPRQVAADPTFRQFVADTLAVAQWPKNYLWKDLHEEKRDALTTAAARGELADLAELHLEILKEKMKGETA